MFTTFSRQLHRIGYTSTNFFLEFFSTTGVLDLPPFWELLDGPPGHKTSKRHICDIFINLNIMSGLVRHADICPCRADRNDSNYLLRYSAVRQQSQNVKIYSEDIQEVVE